TRSGSPLAGCRNSRVSACSAWRRKPRSASTNASEAPRGRRKGPPYSGSPTIGCLRWAMCTRIWWVRPVSSRHSSAVCARKRSRSRKWVTASRPSSRTAMRMRSRGWRSIGASAVPPETSAPTTTARYWRCTSRAESCATSAVCASSVRATTITPEVSLSSRCTMPARGSAASAGSRCSSAFTRVPDGLPAPGCTTSPAGLSITRTSASSCRIDSGMSSGSARTWSSGSACRVTASPPCTGSRGRARAPSSKASPDLIQAASRERENSGNSSARTASKRRPAADPGTVAWRLSRPSRAGWESGSVMRASWRALLLSGVRASGAFDSPPMTPRQTPRFLLRPVILLLLAVVLATPGCSTVKGFFKDKDANEGVPVTELYDKGHQHMVNGNWSSAITVYKRLVAQYPYGPYTEQAMMETAYAQFKSGRNEEAISSIDRFLRTYPTHRNVPYFYYLRGLVNSNRDTVFLQRVCSLDASRRDLSTPMQAFNDFKIVTER